ncbi:MAG: LysE family translocator [Clostridia bacterium]|nr:LysE family translocator [Clostridia bacterium]
MSLIKGLLFGLTLQLAIGPVFFAVLHKSIKEGFYEAFKMVMGVTLVDTFYIILSFTGIGALLKIKFLNKLIFWGGAGVLIYFGYKYIKSFLKNSSKDKAASEAGNGEVMADQQSKSRDSLLYGVKLTLTNPLTIVFWSGIFGALIGAKKLAGLQDILFYSAGCVLSTVLFLGIFSLIGKYITRFLNSKRLRYLDCVVGVFLVLFGFSMFLK